MDLKKIRNKLTILLVFMTFSYIINLSGCGQNSNPVANVISQIELKSYKVGSDEWIQMKAGLVTGNFMLAGINAPITDPTDLSKVYGQIGLLPVLCGNNPNCQGGGDLTISLNITQVTQVQGVAPILPNGTGLPLGGLQNAHVVALPIGNTGGRIYFAFGPGVGMLGTAIPFSVLDPSGQYVPGVNVFQPLQLGPVSLIAGIFAGSVPNTTGIGLFADLTSILFQTPLLRSLAFDSQQQQRSSRGGVIEYRNALTMKPIRGSERDEKQLYQELYKLHKVRPTLQLK
jgi:hypothetical protein